MSALTDNTGTSKHKEGLTLQMLDRIQSTALDMTEIRIRKDNEEPI